MLGIRGIFIYNKMMVSDRSLVKADGPRLFQNIFESSAGQCGPERKDILDQKS